MRHPSVNEELVGTFAQDSLQQGVEPSPSCREPPLQRSLCDPAGALSVASVECFR